MRYQKRLTNLVSRIEGDILAMAHKPTYREDANKSTRTEIRALIRQIRKKYNVIDSRKILAKIFQQTNRFNIKEFNKAYKTVLGIRPYTPERTIEKAFINENVALIKSIPKQLLDDVEDVMLDALEKGTRNEIVASKLMERTGVARSRARLIARDQIGKIQGQLNAKRQQKAGVNKFEWSTSNDERVRPEHRRLNGQIFEYPNGHPKEGIPGQPIQCRCSAIPVLEYDED